MHDICDTKRPIAATHGYLNTPGYPRILGLPSTSCSAKIKVPLDFHIKVYLLDTVGIGSRGQSGDCNVRLKLKEKLARARGNSGGPGESHKQQVVTCLEASYLRNELIYTSFTNSLSLQIFVGDSYNYKKKKGVLLYFEGKMLIYLW